MFFGKNTQPQIDSGRLAQLTDGVKTFLEHNYTAPAEPKPSQGVQFSRRSGDIRFSEDENSRFSLDDGHYNPAVFNKSMRSFISGTSNVTAETLFGQQVNRSFSDTLIRLINREGMRDSEVYKAAGIDRRLFSKIISNRDYKPSKNTCIALALAMKLDIDDANEFISRAGYTLSHSIKRDLVIEYCIREKEYSVMYVNELLHRLGMEPLSGV